MVIGRKTIKEHVIKWLLPFVGAAIFTSLTEWYQSKKQCARIWKCATLHLAMAVRIGDMVSSASFIVGAVTIWWVVLVSIVAK